MPLKGSAFLALWNDIEPRRQAEYDAWHTFEHVPERVGIPGFVAGRRYVAAERLEQRYFTLYELGSLEALTGPSYVEVVEHPTDWSLSMRPSFRNVVRQPCMTVLGLGLGMTGSLATLRFGTGEPARAVDADMARSALLPLLQLDQITGLHLGRVVATTPPSSMGALGWGQATDGGPQHVLLVEGLERRALEAARASVVEILRRELEAAGDIAFATFDLAFMVTRAELPTTCNRQPARSDLQRHWNAEGTVDAEKAATEAARKGQ
jgi:hypothetical protein